MAPHFFDIPISQVNMPAIMQKHSGLSFAQWLACLPGWPGLHIALGIFFQLFTLLEDECHKLDIKMAAITLSSPGVRQAYIRYSEVVFRERQVLDKKSDAEKHLILIQQTLTCLALNSSNLSADPTIRCVYSRVAAHKRQLQSFAYENKSKKSIFRKTNCHH